MDKRFLVLLIVPSLLFSWGCAYANETEELIVDSGDQGKQSRRSREGRDDSRGSRGEQSKGLDRDSQRQQSQKQQYGKQELRDRKSNDDDRDRYQRRNSDQKRDSGDQKRGWESDKKGTIKNFPDRFKEGDKDRRGERRERISRERLKEREIRWRSKSKAWRRNFSHNRRRDHIFDDQFWDHFRRRRNHWYFDNNFQWYAAATWPRIVVWLPWQWSQPIYYFYETDGDVYYSTTEDFTYLIPVQSKELFIDQAARIANRRYPISTQQSDWMPLGMFTFALDDDSSNMPKMYISLAVSKEGTVAGAYFDVANNITFEIQGGVDPESQRIAWKFVGNDWPIMESGLYNLTKEESTLLIHTSSRTTETQLLIRID